MTRHYYDGDDIDLLMEQAIDDWTEEQWLKSTTCPKIGAYQWTCTYDECTCHLKENIREKTNSPDPDRNGN